MLKMKIKKDEFESMYNARYVNLNLVEKERYLVSDYGDVWRVDRFDGTYLYLAQLETRGYTKAGLHMTHFPHCTVPTAKVVASAFVDGYAPGRDRIIFLDGNKANDSAENLKWATYKEVMQNYYAKKKAREEGQRERDGYVLVSSKEKSDAIEKVLEEQDKLELAYSSKPYPDAVWEGDELGWVVYSKEPATIKYVDQSSYERTEKEEKAQDIISNKQLRHAYKWGNGYDPEGEF